MADANSVEVILDFLRRNRFTRAEAALRSELSNCSDVNGLLQKLTLEEKAACDVSQNDKGKLVVENQGLDSRDSVVDISKELVVKEIECGNGRNAAESKRKTAASTEERNKSNEVVGTSGTNFPFLKSSEDGVFDLHSWKINVSNGPVEPCQNDGGSRANNKTLKAPMSQQSKNQTSEALDVANSNAKSGEENNVPAEKKSLWLGNSGKASMEPKVNLMQNKESKETDRQLKFNSSSLKENMADNVLSRTDENVNSSSDIWKDCSVKTVFPFSKGDVSTSYNGSTYSDKIEEKRKAEIGDVRGYIKEQVDEVGRTLYLGKLQGSSEQKIIGGISFPLPPEKQKEEFPRLPPVKIKSEDKPLAINWGEKFDSDGFAAKLTGADSSLLIGSYLDVPIGQEIKNAG